MKLAIFDIDRTIVRGYSQVQLVIYLHKKNIVKTQFLFKVLIWGLLEYLGKLNNPTVVEKAFSMLKGQYKDRIDHLLKSFFEEVLKKRIYTQVVRLVDEYKREGYKIVLLTEVFRDLAKHFKRFLDADYLISTELESKKNRYTGRVKGKICYGKNKLILFKKKFQNISLKYSYMYSDSYSDLPMLKLVANPIALNPDRKLYKIAKRMGWEILKFN